MLQLQGSLPQGSSDERAAGDVLGGGGRGEHQCERSEQAEGGRRGPRSHEGRGRHRTRGLPEGREGDGSAPEVPLSQPEGSTIRLQVRPWLYYQ